ncbi:MAG TPA: S8 family serine peptidase [Ignavibacteriaceae bacterium]|nr:S8 family serine peptidase [Ignavibacteriaceae bacterium]
MKNLITLLIIAAVFSLNVFPQNSRKNFNPDVSSKQDRSKIINLLTQNSGTLNNKISPLLGMFVDKIKSEGGLKVRLPEPYRSYKKIINFHDDELDGITIPVLIRTNSVSAAAGTIKSFNGIVETISGDIISAEIPVISINKITASPEILYVDASTISEVKINVSRIEAKVDLLHNGTGISRPYKGNGVVVGLVDSGIDWKHSDFHNANGNRIKYLWDMSGQGNPPSGYDYGTEYTKAQLDANQCQEIDGDDGEGHGTHVSGTAAGNGSALADYIGMAPLSDIIFVKGFRNGPGFASTDVINGCNYIFQKASQMGEPAVINLSLGGHFGPHDGSSLYEQGLSNLTGDGRIIVAAAGNEGGETIHLSYAAGGSSYSDAYETLVDMPAGTPIAVSDMWYNNGNINVGLAAYDPDTFTIIGYSNAIPPGQKIEDVEFNVGGTVYGYITIDATGTSNPNNGANEVLIAIDSHNGQINISNVVWSVYTYGTGTFDAWMVTGGTFSDYSTNWFKPGDNNSTVGQPGTANKIICVGAYCTKDHWVDIDGITRYQPGNPVIGQISWFSSLGPSRDGRLKPDIVAPGEAILAALSEDLTNVPRENILLGGMHQKMQGTSMASPHVTGSVALLLEKNPSLNYDETVALLEDNAKQDAFTGNSPGNTYGYGKLDAYAAFLNTPGGGGTQTNTLIEEGFENTWPPSGWTTQVLNSYYTWSQGNVQDHNFNEIDPSSVYSAICMWVAEDQNEWLITPAFDLGNGTASLEFYAGFSTAYLSFATLNLNISTNGGTNWNQIWSAGNDGLDWTWRDEVVDLTAYANKQNLKLAWQYVGNDGDIVGLDAVKLTETVSTGTDDNKLQPAASFKLYQNYPNPFNPNTTINYSIPAGGNVQLKIYNILSQEVLTLVNGYNAAGEHHIEFKAAALPSGVYFYRIQSGRYIEVKKMILLK